MNAPVVIDSARPRAGRRFEPTHELELEVDALDAARSLPGANRGLVVLREVAGPFGVPDLLALVGPRAVLERRLSLDVPPLLNQVDAGVVATATPRAPKRPEELARRLGWSVESVNRRVPDLLRSGALMRIRNGFVRPPDLQPVGRLYAVETKVKNWRRALRQARAYSLWCDSYVLVMQSLSAAALPTVIDSVALDGGGLMVAGRWLQRPRVGRRAPMQRLWGSEHVVAAMLEPET